MSDHAVALSELKKVSMNVTILLMTQSVGYRVEPAGDDSQTQAFNVYEDAKDRFEFKEPKRTILISTEEWADMGSPEEITVILQPGDRLQDDSPGN